MQIRPEAAYLYDAVHLYANALLKVLDSNKNPYNGTAIIHYMKETQYESAMGWVFFCNINSAWFNEINSYVLKLKNTELRCNYKIFLINLGVRPGFFWVRRTHKKNTFMFQTALGKPELGKSAENRNTIFYDDFSKLVLLVFFKIFYINSQNRLLRDYRALNKETFSKFYIKLFNGANRDLKCPFNTGH